MCPYCFFRGWIGYKAACWNRRIRELKEVEAQGVGFLRQKYVGDAMEQQELAVLAQYTKLEIVMSETRREMEAMEKTGKSLRWESSSTFVDD